MSDESEAREFPVVCEDCLGPNPYVRMQKMPLGGECAISGRPFTVFRWRPGNEARYKKTVVCKEIAQAKNVCQVCLLDLDYGIPVAARDAALGRAGGSALPSSSVNRDFAVNEIAKKLDEGEDAYEKDGKEKNNELLMRLARKKPYYNKNKTPICTFWLRNACTRNDCPYRPCNGDTHMPELSAAPELRKQNIKDRYFGTNDPVAEQMLKRAKERPSQKLTPPEDASITTLFVGGVDPEKVTEDDINSRFYQYGEIKGIRVIGTKKCAFHHFRHARRCGEGGGRCGDKSRNQRRAMPTPVGQVGGEKSERQPRVCAGTATNRDDDGSGCGGSSEWAGFTARHAGARGDPHACAGRGGARDQVPVDGSFADGSGFKEAGSREVDGSFSNETLID